MSPEKGLRRSSLEDREQDREKIFQQLFSDDAKIGYDREFEDGIRHYDGWYDIFPNLTHEVIDEIVERNAQKAKDAKKIGYVGSLLEGDLRRASVKTRIFQDKEKGDKKQLKKDKKELKKVKKEVKRLKHDIYP